MPLNVKHYYFLKCFKSYCMKTFCLISLLFIFVNYYSYPQNIIQNYTKISSLTEGFTSYINGDDYLGQGIDYLGDIDNNGYGDFVVGAPKDDDGAYDAGAVYIFLMKENFKIKSVQKISSTSGNLGISLKPSDYFGRSVSVIGDINNDKIIDIAVSAYRDDDGAKDAGAVYIIFLNNDGTAKYCQKISSTVGNLGFQLNANCDFGSYLNPVGDIDGDNVPDLIIGAEKYNLKGAIFIVRLNPNGTVKSTSLITEQTSGFNITLDIDDYFGSAVTTIGDLNKDGHIDLAVSAMNDDDGGTNKGAVYILFLNGDMNIIGYQKISNLEGNFFGLVRNNDLFGASLSGCNDFNQDGFNDLIVGCPSPNYKGRFFILFLLPNGMVKNFIEVGENNPLLTDILSNDDRFSWDLKFVDDINSDNFPELLCAAYKDDDGGTDRGAFYIFSLNKNLYSIKELISNQSILFPNPFSNYLEINSCIITEPITSIKLYDNLGHLIYSNSENVCSKIIIDNDLKNGIYFYVIWTDNHLFNGKIEKLSY